MLHSILVNYSLFMHLFSNYVLYFKNIDYICKQKSNAYNYG